MYLCKKDHFSVLFFFFLVFFNAQGFHVTTTKLTELDNGLALSVKFNKTDLDKALGQVINENTPANVLEGFINKYLKVGINGTVRSAALKSKSLSRDTFFVELEIYNSDVIKSIVVENSLLTGYFKDQKNIVNIVLKKKRNTVILENGQTKAQLNV